VVSIVAVPNVNSPLINGRCINRHTSPSRPELFQTETENASIRATTNVDWRRRRVPVTLTHSLLNSCRTRAKNERTDIESAGPIA